MGEQGQPSNRITGHTGSGSWATRTPESLDLPGGAYPQGAACRSTQRSTHACPGMCSNVEAVPLVMHCVHHELWCMHSLSNFTAVLPSLSRVLSAKTSSLKSTTTLRWACPATQQGRMMLALLWPTCRVSSVLKETHGGHGGGGRCVICTIYEVDPNAA